MAISLNKGQQISLEKESGTSLSRVIMGLGWDVAKKKGFLGFGGGSSIDLDASCVILDNSKTVTDIVYFGHLKSKDKNVQHTGDNLTGEGDGDDEQIIVELSKFAPETTCLVFTINSYSGQTFDEVENAYARIVNASNNIEIARYTLGAGSKYTAMIMAKVYKENNEWKMQAIGQACNGKTVKDLEKEVMKIV